MIGQTVAHYRVTAALGAGGMGEVYRATDTKLNREVAIKVLPPEVAGDPERLARFQREAQLLAALNHPNIAAIHGLEEADGTPFLALELVEGEDLKGRLDRGAIPVDDALEIAGQIAEALEEAHARGIVHRDLKPANVKLTPDGRVKVLDFGLAKAWGGEGEGGGSSIDLSQSPTLARTGTLAGVILGTAAYMSPEQAAGRAVDKRADIWSFGVVLFEMLTGKALFTGETASEVMASVIKEEPAWESLPPGCPPPVERLLRRCLRKKPRERLQDMGDARIELADVLAGAHEETATDAASVAAMQEEARRGRLRERWAWVTVALVLAGLGGTLAWRGVAGGPGSSGVLRAELPVPAGHTFAEPEAPQISPDGRHLALVLQRPGEPRQLWLHSLGSTEARPVKGTEGARLPFWAPDSQSVAFASEGHLEAVRVGDGVVQRICSLPGPRFGEGTWSESGLIVFSSAGPGDLMGDGYSLFSVSAQGGAPEPFTTLDESRGETRHVWPRFLPGGSEVLAGITATERDGWAYYAIPLEAPSERRRLDAPGVEFQTLLWASAGDRTFLFYTQDATLLAQPLDTAGLRLSGVATPIAEGVAWYAGFKRFSVSANGAVVHLSAPPVPDEIRLAWVDRTGKEQGDIDAPGQLAQLALSADGERIAMQTMDGRGLWVVGARRGLATRVTVDTPWASNPVWSPDGQKLVYAGPCDGRHCVFVTNLAEGVPPTRIVESELQVYPESWTEHGNTLVYLEGPLQNRALRAVSVGSGTEPELLLQTGFGLDEPQVSPDGRWLAYLADDTGEMELYVRPFRRPGERLRVSARGAGQPKWRADGREVFYVSGERWLTAVEVRDRGDSLELGPPHPLFEVNIVGADDALNDLFAPAPGGQRFLVAVPERERSPQRLQLTLNWPALVE